MNLLSLNSCWKVQALLKTGAASPVLVADDLWPRVLVYFPAIINYLVANGVRLSTAGSGLSSDCLCTAHILAEMVSMWKGLKGSVSDTRGA